MASTRSLMSPSPFQLALLPTVLLDLVLTYLPLPCKFRSVTRLSRHFPQLTASAFQHDVLYLSYPCLRWLGRTSDLNMALFDQLRVMVLPSSDWFAHRRGVELGPLLTRVLSSSPTIGQPFSALRVLSLWLPADDSLQLNRTLHSVSTSFAASLPLLHTLRVGVPYSPLLHGERMDTTAVVCGWLPRLPSLRHLTLAGTGVDARSLFILFSLPLLSIDMRECGSIPRTVVGSYADAALLAVSGALRRLCLPAAYAEERGWDAHIAQLLQRYAERAQSNAADMAAGEGEEHEAVPTKVAIQPAWQLKSLRYERDTLPTWLRFATALPSLTSLHISSFPDRDALRSFFTAATPASLPHLTRLVVPVIDVETERADNAQIDESCLAFFPLFAQQLRYLTPTSLPASARSCQRLFASVLTCTKLVTLTVINDIALGQPFTLPARIHPLPQLEKLYIHSPTHRNGQPSHLQHADVVRLLQACPAVTDLLLSLPNASINLLPAIARSCRQLRTLTILSDDDTLWDMSDELATVAAQPPDGAFGSLHTLRIDHDRKKGQNTPHQPSAALLAALTSLLCCAPIRRLCLVAHVDVTNIPFYAAFPHLVRLRLHNHGCATTSSTTATRLTPPSQAGVKRRCGTARTTDGDSWRLRDRCNSNSRRKRRGSGWWRIDGKGRTSWTRWRRSGWCVSPLWVSGYFVAVVQVVAC